MKICLLHCPLQCIFKSSFLVANVHRHVDTALNHESQYLEISAPERGWFDIQHDSTNQITILGPKVTPPKLDPEFLQNIIFFETYIPQIMHTLYQPYTA